MEKEGKKYDEEKPHWVLMPWDVIEEIVQDMMHGAKKYGPYNWKRVRPALRYWEAAFRHMFEYLMHTLDNESGDCIDKDSGIPSLSMAACNLIFLRKLEKSGVKDSEEDLSKWLDGSKSELQKNLHATMMDTLEKR